MNAEQYFTNQIAKGATEMFFYGLERPAEQIHEISVSIMSHKETLDSFPANLEFVRMLSESTPLFREVEQ